MRRCCSTRARRPAIEQAVERLLGDPALARELRKRGLARARGFSWERTARLTLDSYARALGAPAPSSGTSSAPTVSEPEGMGAAGGGVDP